MSSPEPHITYDEAVQYYLTDTELKVVKLVGKGLTSKKIAKKLNCAPSTVQTHRRNIKKKLNLKGYKTLEEWCGKNFDSLYGSNS